MNEFSSRGTNTLRRLPTGAKVVYAGFLVFLLLGLLTAGLLHADSMGLDGAAAWWRGDEAAMSYPKSYRQLLELTHFHLFTEPVTWLVVAHLYQLSGGRGWVTMGTLGAIVAQIALPWVITYLSAAPAVLFAPVSGAVVLGLGWMSVASLRELVAPRS